ncbi:LETM1-like protein-domain-containing protein [Gongronella butleri]|nr:LETM1-like protein-domain-containing protein [Gongronella butleri]
MVPPLIPSLMVFGLIPSTYLFGLTPSTCIKHAQLEKQRDKLDKQRQIMSSNIVHSELAGKGISPNDFLSVPRFSKFNSHYGHHFTLDKLDRDHLWAYCRFMGLSSWGTRGMLRSRLAYHFDYIKKDDQLLSLEGIDTLTLHELQQANEERGMRSLAKDEDALRSSLKNWLATRSIKPELPTGLLVFSRMFLLNANYDANKFVSLQN